ncbi:metallophosphoesterase [Catalinimonas niigatensis]|uniref:metallophosphoesterase n=1 Tax=Catalinimonas niigatensis TaxID=1397264 RepID=UPI00266569A1|nr:metallophosphoesterase [Catalinimonas niigatensis]WPP53049.1 metallophosphoesterase [Catalinimonas niigatensis]
MASKQALFSFGVIADAQYCDCEPAIGRYYRKSVQKLSDCLQTLNQHELSFILDMGDLIDRDFSSFDKILEVYGQSKFRVYRTLGNHDYAVEEDKKQQVAARLGMHESAYYDFIYLGWRFIVLNGNEVSTFAHPPGREAEKEAQEILSQMQARQAINAKEWNGGISGKQLQWLETKLEEAKVLNQKTIVMGHYPLYPPDPHNLWNDEEVVRLLTAYSQVVAYFNGHHHAGNYGQKAQVHFLNFKGMVETEEENTFAVVEVYQDRLWVKGFGREESRELKIG